MGEEVIRVLNDYYNRMHIHPDNFECPNQSICRQAAYQGNMTETKMSMVGSLYGKKFPKIVVVSLDPPQEKDGVFQSSKERTIEFVSRFHETENYVTRRPNVHWAVTQIIVKDLLICWGYPIHAGSAVVGQSYSGQRIENVSAYFAHVNVAKCSMNNPGKGQAKETAHRLCSRAYLLDELSILKPDIFISQGADANGILGELLIGKAVIEDDLPKSETVNLDGKSFLWLPMHHPARQVHKIRSEWPDYMRYIHNWRLK